MRKLHQFFLTLLLSPLGSAVFSQSDETYFEYSEYAAKEFGIICRLPELFTVLEDKEPWWIRRDRYPNLGMIYGPVLRSLDEDCIVMCPSVPMYISESAIALSKIMEKVDREVYNHVSNGSLGAGANENLPRRQISREMTAALGLHDTRQDTTFVFGDYVTTFAGNLAREMFNADTVYVYEIPLEAAYRTDYIYCTAIAIAKYDRATLFFKLFFTEEGKKREPEYIKQLSGSFWYEEGWAHGKETRFVPTED